MAASKPIKILLADDQAVFREGLRTLLSGQPDFEVVGEAADGQAALQLAARLRPAVVLMDLDMPILDGVAATRRLNEAQPGCKVIVLATFDDEMVCEALRAGAVGYVLKDTVPGKLVEAVRAAARGELFLQPSSAAKTVAGLAHLSNQSPRPAQPLIEPLSEREMDVLRLIAAGASNKDIAARLCIAGGTVRNHVTNILGKLGVSDRVQAVLKAQELGLV